MLSESSCSKAKSKRARNIVSIDEEYIRGQYPIAFAQVIITMDILKTNSSAALRFCLMYPKLAEHLGAAPTSLDPPIVRTFLYANTINW
jgi:hypothetical protein